MPVADFFDLPAGPEDEMDIEGLAVVRREGMDDMLLVVFDSPAPSRLLDDTKTIDADLFSMPGAKRVSTPKS